jgi:hypothetical protein
MKITGITIIRNAVKNDYPIVEAIRSVLPAVDEMIVSVGDSEDDTESLIKAIGSPKIHIIHSVWDKTIRSNGSVLAVETNKVLDAVSPDTDWIFYIQGDEVMHEKYIDTVKNACAVCLDDKKIDGILFNYLHFYGTYDYIADSRKWYKHETRIIRNDKTIRSYRDAQGFRRGHKKIRVAATDAYIYHYGWVKSPEKMKTKHKEVAMWWNPDDASLQAFRQSGDEFDFSRVDSVKRFSLTHPEVMKERIRNKNWEVMLDEKKISMKWKHLLLHYFEKATGIRLFSFSNHRIVRKLNY